MFTQYTLNEMLLLVFKEIYHCYQILCIAGMVIMIVQREYFDFKACYPDPQIKYITCVDSDFNNTRRLRMSLDGFISKGIVVRLLKNEDNITLITEIMK